MCLSEFFAYQLPGVEQAVIVNTSNKDSDDLALIMQEGTGFTSLENKSGIFVLILGFGPGQARPPADW